jgi:uncharacterized membrane protein YgcG
MQKLAMIIGAVLLLAGVATAGTFARLGASEDRPTITTEAPPAATQAGDVRREDRGADRRANRREDRAAEARGDSVGLPVTKLDTTPRELAPTVTRKRSTAPAPTRATTTRATTSVDDHGGTRTSDDRSGRGSGSGSGSGSSGHGGGDGGDD